MSPATRRRRRRGGILPTERYNPRRNLEALDVLAALAGPERRAVHPAKVAERLGLAVKTVSGTPGFFEQAGLTEPGLRGMWKISPAGMELARLRATDPQQARVFLRGHWQGMWFQREAQRLLAAGPLEEGVFADRLAGHLPGRRERRLYLVEWLAYALIVEQVEHGRVALPQESGRGESEAGPAGADRTRSLIEVLVHRSAEEISALPTGPFLELMAGCDALFTSLVPLLSPAPEAPHTA
ncbi:hypothetical protein ACSNOK_19800 [Streptomyces sp. URMC 126]|uniref:hypothetical protein n=1 Tax=Streptomyces sp. URMC 126 TaxID=3423401 RepID=UPI003F1D5420